MENSERLDLSKKMKNLLEETAELKRILCTPDYPENSQRFNNEPIKLGRISSKTPETSQFDRELLEELVEEFRGVRKELAEITRRQEYQEQFCMELLEILKAENSRIAAQNQEIFESLNAQRAEVTDVKKNQESLGEKYSKLASRVNEWHQKTDSSIKENQKAIKELSSKITPPTQAPAVKRIQKTKKVAKEPVKLQIDREIVGTWQMVSEENCKKYLEQPSFAGITVENYSSDLKFVVDGDKVIWSTVRKGAPTKQFVDQLRLKTAGKECSQKKNRIRTVYKNASNGKELERICRFTEDGQLVITAQRGEITCKRVFKRIN